MSDLFAGQYQTSFKGRGMEFAEVRPYLPGDEVRTIDWNVTARTASPTSSASPRSASSRSCCSSTRARRRASAPCGSSSSELAAELAALLAFSAITNNDKVGLVIFSDRIELALPPRKGNRHVLRVIREILNYEPEGRGTDLQSALDCI